MRYDSFKYNGKYHAQRMGVTGRRERDGGGRQKDNCRVREFGRIRTLAFLRSLHTKFQA